MFGDEYDESSDPKKSPIIATFGDKTKNIDRSEQNTMDSGTTLNVQLLGDAYLSDIKIITTERVDVTVKEEIDLVSFTSDSKHIINLPRFEASQITFSKRNK